MKLIIHRGAKEIGGSCIELISENSRILLDLGLPLVDENSEQVDSRKITNKPGEELIKDRILPDIKGLYGDEKPAFDAILLSHPHQDHYGLLSYVNPGIPVYLSRGCRILVEASNFFNQSKCDLKNVVTVEDGRAFRKGDFTITPFLVDHSGFDALAYLIECKGKRVFYSGDFRGHGRKSKLFYKMLRNPPGNIGYLILEGTMIGREEGAFHAEKDIEGKLVSMFRGEGRLFFIACSSQNIDRIVSVYRACKRAGRTFVIDPYTAYILDRLKDVSKRIPQATWGKTMRVYFITNDYTEKLAKEKKLFRYASAKIELEEIAAEKNRFVIKSSYYLREKFARNNLVAGSKLVYSMWEGYWDKEKDFWEASGVPVENVHCSGHAYEADLKRFAAALKPRRVIPNHTFFPEKYPGLFGEGKVLPARDGETITL